MKTKFVAAVKAGLEAKFPGKEIRVADMLKNNGCVRTGISVKGSGENIVPTVYIDDFYKEYVNKNEDGRYEYLQEVIDNIAESLIRNRVSDDFDVKKYTDYEQAKKGIFLTLVDSGRNASLLEKVPHRHLVGQYAIVYRYLVNEVNGSTGTILVQNPHVELWGVSERDLYDVAVENTSKLNGVDFMTMEAMLRSMMFDKKPESFDGDFQEMFEEVLGQAGTSMYILSNKKRYLGAGTIALPGITEALANAMDSNFFVIPSSIHELIIVKDDGEANADDLNQMVHDVNTTQVEENEVLGDTVLYYDRETGILKVAESSFSI